MRDDRREQPRNRTITVEYWPALGQTPLTLSGLNQQQANHTISMLSDVVESGEYERVRVTVQP